MASKYVYDSKFEGNILLEGRTGCGKTSFVKNFAVENIFGKLEKLEWVSQITLSEQREAQMQSCFSSQVEFHYPNGVNGLKDLVNQIKKVEKVLLTMPILF